MNRIIKGIHTASRILCYLSMAALGIMLFLGAGDVIGRYFFNKPIIGTQELCEVLLPAVALFAWAYTLSLDRHVSVDILMDHLSNQKRLVISYFTLFVSLIIFAVILWKGAGLAFHSWKTGELINTVYIPIAPFQFFTAIGAFFMCLELIAQLMMLINSRHSNDGSRTS